MVLICWVPSPTAFYSAFALTPFSTNVNSYVFYLCSDIVFTATQTLYNWAHKKRKHFFQASQDKFSFDCPAKLVSKQLPVFALCVNENNCNTNKLKNLGKHPVKCLRVLILNSTTDPENALLPF